MEARCAELGYCGGPWNPWEPRMPRVPKWTWPANQTNVQLQMNVRWEGRNFSPNHAIHFMLHHTHAASHKAFQSKQKARRRSKANSRICVKDEFPDRRNHKITPYSIPATCNHCDTCRLAARIFFDTRVTDALWVGSNSEAFSLLGAMIIAQLMTTQMRTMFSYGR